VSLLVGKSSGFRNSPVSAKMKTAALAMVFLALTVCGASAKQPWEVQWEKTLDAARKEGVVVVSGPPGEAQRGAITGAWTKAYPDIRLDYTGARGTQVVASVVRERASGIFNWDVIVASVDPTVFSLVPINALAPFRDALIKPELTDDKTWIGGFAGGFLDDQRKFFYAATGTVDNELGFVNRDCIPKSAFNKAQDFMKPEFKGKIVWFDPTLPGFGDRANWLVASAQGTAWLKELLLNHDVTFTRDYKQMSDWLVNCTKPIAIGMSDDVIAPMEAHGIGTKSEQIAGPAYLGKATPGWTGANDSIGWYNNAPHPNAAKIFVNWYLSHDFQQLYADAYRTDSRRTDTKPADPNPSHWMKPGVPYRNLANAAAARQFKALQADIKSWGVGQ
jgi:iron(III) transport system substrate-binding protein